MILGTGSRRGIRVCMPLNCTTSSRPDQGLALQGLRRVAHEIGDLQGQERLVRRADMLEGLVSATVNAMGSDP